MAGRGNFRGSITILRNPVKRSVSGYLFRGHSPNWDRFNVRKEFPNYPSQKPKYSFDQYLNFTEYHNIITRMMAHNSFPYRNIEVTHRDMVLAKDRLATFKMIGIQEAFEASVRLMLHKFGVKIPHEVWSKTYTAVPLKSSSAKAPKKASFIGSKLREGSFKQTCCRGWDPPRCKYTYSTTLPACAKGRGAPDAGETGRRDELARHADLSLGGR